MKKIYIYVWKNIYISNIYIYDQKKFKIYIFSSYIYIYMTKEIYIYIYMKKYIYNIYWNGSLRVFVVLRRTITYWRTIFFVWDTIIGSLKNSLRKWFFKEPWFERFFVEPEMVLLWHHSKEPYLVPDAPSYLDVHSS